MGDVARPRVVVIGGGAAGFFGAIACAEAATVPMDILILERGREVLGKVRISGGGRCNVTHDLDDARVLVEFYPRGARSLIGPFNHWSQGETVAWFESHGVPLKIEPDGRMFPVTDRSETVIECLLAAAEELGIRVRKGAGVASLRAVPAGGWDVELDDGDVISAEAVLMATGGTRSGAARAPARSVAQELEKAVPSLFTFKIDDPGLTELAGISVDHARVSIEGERLSASGPLLVTHWGVSGPAILKLSAWGARRLEALDYRFTLSVDWCGGEQTEDSLRTLFSDWRSKHGARSIAKRSPLAAIPRRLWSRFVGAAGIEEGESWAALTKGQAVALRGQLLSEKLSVDGKSLNKDEFVTCGGVPLQDVDLRTMQSRTLPGLFFAGEVLDIDGLTGGFNFQAAWTTGRIAGESIAQVCDV